MLGLSQGFPLRNWLRRKPLHSNSPFHLLSRSKLVSQPPHVHLKTLGAATNAGGRLNAQTQPHFCTSSLQKTLSLLLVFPKPCHINLCSLVPPYNQLQNFFCNTSQGRLQECQGYGQSRPDRTLDQLRQFSGSLNATCVGPESRFPTQKLAETQALGIKQNIGS